MNTLALHHLVAAVLIATLHHAVVAVAAVPVPPTHANVAYGPHERNVLDFYQASGTGPRPLVVSIHGGGWTQGEKPAELGRGGVFLAKGISYAAINYRLSTQAPLPAPVRDAARAIQFLRSKATDWNIDKGRIGLTGGSAGACSSMWILLHDDLADPNAEDPVLRESTRVTAAAVVNGQTSIEPKVIEQWLGPAILKHRMIWSSVGAASMAEVLGHYERYAPLYAEFSPIRHLTRDDPPLLMTYGHPMALPPANANHAIHHPVFGLKMKEEADRLGLECHLIVQDDRKLSAYESAETFLIDKLLKASTPP